MDADAFAGRASRTKGREATQGVIPGRFALSVGMPDLPAPAGWKWTALSDVAQLESGHTPSRKHPEYWNEGVPWIGIKDAVDSHGRVIVDTYQHVSQLGLENSSARLLPVHTVCLSRTASVGYVVVMGRSMATSQVGAFNVIPDAVRLIGTVRTFRPETRELAEQRVREIVTTVAAALGGSAGIDYRRGYPATVNTEREAQFAAKVGEKIFGKDNVQTDGEPSMGGEDFSYMLQARPGAYVWLGQGGGPLSCFLHNPGYDFNDDVIPLGAGYLAALVEESLPIK